MYGNNFSIAISISNNTNIMSGTDLFCSFLEMAEYLMKMHSFSFVCNSSSAIIALASTKTDALNKEVNTVINKKKY